MEVRPERAVAVDRIARRLMGLKPRYQEVERVTRVPWFIIAVLHQRESDADFTTHLHNGDPLTARTRHVPAGRPATGSPPFTWQTSAIDALTMRPHSLHLVDSWPVERACYEMEKYNGFGYRKFHLNSPYLWSFSTLYDRGKFVADNHFNPTVPDQQCGTMPIIRRMMDLDASVQFPSAGTPALPEALASLAEGSRGERVRQLQSALVQVGFPVGEIDGDFGPNTAAAIRAFQSDRGLPQTGIADPATLQALAGKPVGPQRPLTAQLILRTLLSALLRTAPSAGPPSAPPQADAAGNILRAVLAALAGSQPRATPGATGQAGAPASTPILSSIDNMLGGEALAGKKTALAVVAYVILAILQAVGVIGAATPAGQILTVLIGAFGALGGVAKVDRVIQALAIIAAKTPK